MSDPQVTDQGPQPKAKHPSGRPRKPKPTPPLPPPAPYSLEETLLRGDEVALKAGASPASQLRWYSERAQIVKDIQARADAARSDDLQIDNKRLQESIKVFESTQQNLENELRSKERDLVAARAENDK